MIEKPKLLIAVDTYYPKTDGTLRFVEEFVKRAQEFDYHLLAPNFQNKKDTKNITFLDVSKIIKSSGYSSIKISYKNIKKIKQAIKKTDVVFVQGPALISFISIILSKRYKKKCIGYMHIDPWEFFNKFLITVPGKILYYVIRPFLKMAVNKFSLILVPYPKLIDYLREKGITPHIAVARLGVDIQRFSPSKDKAVSKKKMGLDPEKTVVAYVGRISNEKNVRVLYEAIHKLEHPENFFFLMVGDGPSFLTKRFNESPNCQVTGFVTNVENYLQAADIFVMPSLTETTSLATLEAMSCGLPVIVTKVGFMQEYIKKEKNGLFFPKANPTMLALKLEKLQNDPELRASLGRQARRTITHAFSWERSINKIKKIIHQIYHQH